MGLRNKRLIENMLGLLKIRILRGVNLAIRDFNSSDPYVIVRMGTQKLKTRVIKKNLNPEWNELLTLTVEHPILPVRLEVYDKDRFSFDDPMGYAEFDIAPFVESATKSCEGLKNEFDLAPFVASAEKKLEGIQNGTVLKKVLPSRENFLSEESVIRWLDKKVIQDMVLRLGAVECGELEVQLEWVTLPTA